MESKLQYNLITSNMQNVASKISSSIVYADIARLTIDTAKLASYIKYDYALYDSRYYQLVGNIDESIDLSKKIQKIDSSYILVYPTPMGNLGVYYIAIKENILQDRIASLIRRLIFYFVVIYSLITLVGCYLANLFIKPIINERRKLNNFIKDTTHELNTPITAILMSTNKNSPLSSKNIQRINLSAKRISEIYKDLVYLFLQDSKRQRKLENIQIDTIIKEQLEYFEAFANKKRLIINFNLEPTLYYMDKEDFVRLFNNIISNAIKYNKIEGNINIELKDKILKIRDSGIGIKKEALRDIFNRYYRATKEQGGFGIGLNIVYHICKLNNIKVEVSSKEGRWTQFTLIFTN